MTNNTQAMLGENVMLPYITNQGDLGKVVFSNVMEFYVINRENRNKTMREKKN